ncbi:MULTISPECIES: RAD55 family ATPase [Haloarcula]|uniref:Recombinase RecA n=1 Tax=Haloarcula pellucida TaxID=1427151 RepID=A0A830GLT3_9EURY|nr:MULTISPECIES: transcriptional regulator [Halomicroarcula]MBX0348617.1 transcriptional regulator [Halomicroarcula pellucida]MDS0278420.1 transcriptional regulator [Halomicroarcula sp. S1AR25-4]GGN92559.1 recombinase RecA [Halomicroarcula pellucida]
MTRLLRTGIDVLDRKLNGGVPPGSLALLSADPASQSEQFLYELTTPRRTVYVTTARSQRAIRVAMENAGGTLDTTDVYAIGERPLKETYQVIRDSPAQSTIVVDTVDMLETGNTQEFLHFLNDVRDELSEKGSFAVMHGLDGRQVPVQRDVTEYLADIIFELSTEVRGESIENRLIVPKFRGGAPFDETVKLELTQEVAIDTSRDIA